MDFIIFLVLQPKFMRVLCRLGNTVTFVSILPLITEPSNAYLRINDWNPLDVPVCCWKLLSSVSWWRVCVWVGVCVFVCVHVFSSSLHVSKIRNFQSDSVHPSGHPLRVSTQFSRQLEDDKETLSQKTEQSGSLAPFMMIYIWREKYNIISLFRYLIRTLDSLFFLFLPFWSFPRLLNYFQCSLSSLPFKAHSNVCREHSESLSRNPCCFVRKCLLWFSPIQSFYYPR